MTDLKPCPCCGGAASLVKSKQFVEPRYYVSCDECLMKTDMAFEPMTAIDTWNNRIPTPRKCCGNCKYFTDCMDDDWVCHNPNYDYGKRVTGDMECDMWECDYV